MSEYEQVVESFNLEKVNDNLFIGRSPKLAWRRIYGGFLLAVCTRAANLAIDNPEFSLHSLHGYFLRPGNLDIDLKISTELVLNGRSIKNQRITIHQADKIVFTCQISHRRTSQGLSYEPDIMMPDPPESLPTEKELTDTYGTQLSENALRYLRREKVFELRPVNPALFVKPDPSDPSSTLVWARLRCPSLPEPALNAPLLAYLSDMTVLNATLHPHGRNFFDSEITMASLDHAMWMHQQPAWDNWFLLQHEALGNDAEMGLGRLNIRARNGSLIASIVQQGFIKI